MTVELLELALQRSPTCCRSVFVGGATITWDHRPRAPATPTKDVDVIVEITRE